jgi:Aminoglycoside-2''-adenylyltransferase
VATGTFEPDLSLWGAWEPAEVARRLAGVDATWYVTAGWALDLDHGRQTREHEDIEIAVPEDGFDAVRAALHGFELWVIGRGLAHPVTSATLAAHHQTWVREPATGAWRLDVMREPWEGDIWVFRRDPRIRLPLGRVIAHTSDGVPYARPEIALLYKAKSSRPKDDADFASALPLLGDEERQWLARSIALVHPGHHWLQSLEA